jgi:hypothetical protein
MKKLLNLLCAGGLLLFSSLIIASETQYTYFSASLPYGARAKLAGALGFSKSAKTFAAVKKDIGNQLGVDPALISMKKGTMTLRDQISLDTYTDTNQSETWREVLVNAGRITVEFKIPAGTLAGQEEQVKTVKPTTFKQGDGIIVHDSERRPVPLYVYGDVIKVEGTKIWINVGSNRVIELDSNDPAVVGRYI